MRFDTGALKWTNAPNEFLIEDGKIEIITEPHTDLWQRTYYGFRNDNAPMLQLCMQDKYFSFIVKTNFSGAYHRFDQCGAVMYLDSENWLKCSVEYENGDFANLGSVVTNNGYSDWATTQISPEVKTMWYRLSRRGADFKIEHSADGQTFFQMRVCHMFSADGAVNMGIYAASPENSSFKAVFTNMEIAECAWAPHDGQPPDLGL